MKRFNKTESLIFFFYFSLFPRATFKILIVLHFFGFRKKALCEVIGTLKCTIVLKNYHKTVSFEV